MKKEIIQRMLALISFLLCFKDLRNQNVIGFYRTYDDSGYTWTKCDTNCYTCLAGAETDSVHTDHSNQNCLSCDENKGKYFYEEEYNKNIKNCYNKEEMEELLLTSPFFWIQNKILLNGLNAMINV